MSLSKEEYQHLMDEIEGLVALDPKSNTPEGARLKALAQVVEMHEHFGDISNGLPFFWKELQRAVHGNAIEKGWWTEMRGWGELIALMHSELSEALEGARHDNPPSDKIPEFSSLEEEFADVVIRMMDAAEAYGLNVVGAILAKHGYNKGREYKHGGKKF